MLIVLVVVMFLLLAWIALKPGWAPPVPDNDATRAIGEKVINAGDGTRQWWGRVRYAFKSPAQKRFEHYRNWLAEGGLDVSHFENATRLEDVKEVVTWLKAMNEAEMAVFVRSAEIICNHHRLTLNWLWDPHCSPELRQAVQDTFVLQSMTAWKAHTAHALALYKGWKEAPHSKHNREYMQKLYTQLVAHGMVQQSPNLFLAPEKEREAHVVAAIQQAADADPLTFSSVLKGVASYDEIAQPVHQRKWWPNKWAWNTSARKNDAEATSEAALTEITMNRQA